MKTTIFLSAAMLFYSIEFRAESLCLSNDYFSKVYLGRGIGQPIRGVCQ